MAESGTDAGSGSGSRHSGAGGAGGAGLRRFVLEHHPVRGFWTRLDDAWCELRGLQHHPPAVETLLGEALTAAVLLAATLKFQGTLSLQLQGSGAVRLLVAQCTHDFQIRAVARMADTAQAPAGAAAAALPPGPAAQGATGPGPADTLRFAQLVGDGRMVVTIEAEEREARYQGIVALQGHNLAACLENYFLVSEQLPTRIALAVEGTRAAGVLVQKMPGSQAQGEALAARSHGAWEDLDRQLAGLGAQLLRPVSAEDIVRRVCGRHDVRVFTGTAVRFVCRCGRDRVTSLLRALGGDEIRGILAEQGAVTVTCEFCGRPYRYDAVDVERLFAGGVAPDAPASVN